MEKFAFLYHCIKPANHSIFIYYCIIFGIALEVDRLTVSMANVNFPFPTTATGIHSIGSRDSGRLPDYQLDDDTWKKLRKYLLPCESFRAQNYKKGSFVMGRI